MPATTALSGRASSSGIVDETKITAMKYTAAEPLRISANKVATLDGNHRLVCSYGFIKTRQAAMKSKPATAQKNAMPREGLKVESQTSQR
jgi:hypothetical protein